MTERIDAHHHVWDLEARVQPWITGEAMAPIRRSFGVDELTDVATRNGITGTIVVQTVAEVAETDELLDLAAVTPIVAGVVGYVDLDAPDVADQLDRLVQHRAGSWLVGVRDLVQEQPDPAWLLRPAVLAGLRAVAARGLAYDVLIRTDQLGAACDAAAEVAEGRFVLDHLAKPDIASGEWEPWAHQLAALAERPNVSAKVSGLVTEAHWSRWSMVDLRPYVDHALATFGPDRLMFGSDWPVCTLAAPYERVVGVIDELIDELSPDEQAAIRSRTVISEYALAGRTDRTSHQSVGNP